MNKFLFLLFFSFSIFLISCGSEPQGTNPCDLCTENQYCQDNICFNKKCSQEFPEGSCVRGEHCEEGVCVVEYCSQDYPNGKCESDALTCVDGTCQAYECSRTHPNGVCPSGKSCLAPGICGEITCSDTNPTGTCPNGSECSSSGDCVPLPCSVQNPLGSCDDGYECVNGGCLDIDRCTPTNTDGNCGLHQRCTEQGTCIDISCSDNNPDGACPDGEFCERALDAGEWHFSCKVIPSTCTDNDQCPDGYKCNDSNVCEEYSCDPGCKEKEICLYGNCSPDPFFCGEDCTTCWCDTGFQCIENACQVPVNNPCSDVSCEVGKSCIVTDWDNDNGYECVDDADLCSSSNFAGRCDTPQVCVGGACSNPDPCENVSCNEGEICNPFNGACVDNYCSSNPNICTEENTICVNVFDGDSPYQCTCDLGYEYSFNEDKCVLHITACTGKDCGEGRCQEDGWEADGWYCVCDTGMEYLNEGLKHLCIDPTNYDYCTDWDCGLGYCEEFVSSSGEKTPVCICPENYIFDSIQNTCVPGIECGNEICNNPLREKCINDQFCEPQLCSSNYPEGVCNSAETCIAGSCVLTEECSSTAPSGYCMEDYSCFGGVCCKGGNCTTTDNTLKEVGETCNVDSNNCVNDAICIPTPTGDGLCHKLCDQTQADTCNSLNVGDTIYNCVGRDVFNGVNYNKIGVCAVDNNCDRSNNGGCNTNQVCLSFRRTSFTQCYAFEANNPIGSTCSTGQTALGFNVGCDENLLCVDNVCVPNCDNSYKIVNPGVDLCYTPFSQEYEVENLKVKDQGDLLFTSAKKHTEISTCDPNNSNCGAGLTCVKVQDKDSTVGTSKDVGLCTSTCNFNSADYKSECDGTDICFSSNGTSICLGETDCDPATSSSSCAGDEVCYPVTSTLTSCMTSMGMGHIGEACTDACQYGMCIDGTCQYACSIGDNSSCIDGETCQSVTDTYLNSSSHFGTPSNYGTCQ